MAQSILFGWLLTTILALTSAKGVPTDHGYGIWGGELANITELPHQVYIRKAGGRLYCGGSIISSQHILTKKFCIEEPGMDIVVAATNDMLTGGDEYAIAKVTEHPDPNCIIVVLTLAKEIELSEKAKPIALAGPKYKIKDGAKLIASGWGVYNENINKSDKLRKVTISKLSDDKCKNTFNDIDLSQEFCAGGEGKRACEFDDGGPLIEKTTKGNVLVGVIRLKLCSEASRNMPSVFTKVSVFNKWIKKVVKQDLHSNE